MEEQTEAEVPVDLSTMEDLEELEVIIRRAENSVTQTSLQTRTQLFDEILPSILMRANEKIEAFIPTITRIFMDTLRIYHDRASRQLVEKALLRSCKRIKQIGSRMLVRIDKLIPTLASANSGRELAILLRWSCVVVSSSPETYLKPEVLANLIPIQGRLCVALTSCSKDDQHTGYSGLYAVLNSIPAAYESYMSLIESQPVNTENGVLAALIVSHLKVNTKLVLKPEYKELLVKSFNTLVLGVTEKPPQGLVLSFVGFIEILDEETFVQKVLPAMKKILIRTPEIVFSFMHIVVGAFTFDLSPYAREHLIPIARSLLRGSSDEQRAISQRYMKSIFPKLKTESVILDVTKDLFGTLTGADGPLPYWYDRANVLKTIDELKTVTLPDAIPKIASLICEKLAPFAKSESSEEAKGIAFQMIGEWAMSLSTLPANVVQFMVQILSNEKKESVRKACLQSLYQFSNNDALLPQLADTGAPLLTILKNTTGKAASRGEFAAAVRYLLNIATKDPKFAEHLNSKVVSPLIIVNESTIFSLPLLRKASEAELLVTSDILKLLLQKHVAPIERQIAKFKNLSNAVIYLLLCPYHSVRTSIRKIDTAPLPLNITQELISTLNEWVEKSCTGTSEDKFSEDSFAKALLVFAYPQHAESTFESFIILANHPIVARNRWEFPRLWENICRKLFVSEQVRDQVIGSKQESVMNLLFSEKGIYDQSIFRREASISALRNFIKLPAMKPVVLLTRLCDKVKSYKEPSANDIGIYETPDGVVFDQEVRNTYVPEVVESKNVRRSRGDKLYSKADEAWEESVRAELEAKKKAQASEKLGFKSTGDPKQDEIIRKTLEAEGKVRQKVRAMYFEYLQPLIAISSVAEEDPLFTSQNLVLILKAVGPMLKSKVMYEDANDTLRTVCDNMGSKFDLILKGRICSALHILLSNASTVKKEIKNQTTQIFEKLSRELIDPGKFAMTPEQFSFLFPIYKKILETVSFKPDTHRNALKAMEVFLNDPSKIPSNEIITLYLHVASIYPVHSAQAIYGLKAVCVHIPQQNFPSLWEGFTSPLPHIRRATSETFILNEVITKRTFTIEPVFVCRLYIGCFDSDEENVIVAKELWETAGLNIGGVDYIGPLVAMLLNMDETVRRIVASSISGLLTEHPDTTSNLIERLRTTFNSCLDKSGEANKKLNNVGRQGIANAISACASHFTGKYLDGLFQFVITKGLADDLEDVRKQIVLASIDVINIQGAENISILLPIFENAIDKKSGLNDRIREGVVVLLGSLCKFLAAGDPKIEPIIKMLITALNSRSEVVLKSIALALGPLVAMASSKAEEIITGLLNTMLQGKTAIEKRGAAYGLAGVIKGLGIPSLKQFDIIQKLQDSMSETSKGSVKQGALFGFECLCNLLGRLFEPYIVKILPFLLTSFGDSSAEVRNAAVSGSRVIMSQLSGHGVKFVLPVILKGLEEKAWRAKQGSIEMLGNMAYCAPKQLPTCLPSIVPKLVEVMTDTHPQVQQASKEALNRIASVIQNAEIQGLIPVLIDALVEPNTKTKNALESLVNTSFIHRIDSPSLALIVPVLHRGLRERSSETKKRAAQIIGSMCNLADSKDLLPYLQLLLPTLQECLVDPIPESRAVSARAIGSLVRGLGEEPFLEIIPWMMAKMQSDLSSVERSGAAQGLSEVVSALGIERLENILKQILSPVTDPRPSTREGTLYFISYLPGTVGSKLEPYLSRLLPFILRGLADEYETIRDISIRAGKAMINRFGVSSIDLLLPAILDGLHNDNWRIRQSSVQLLGDLLYRIAGASGKTILDGGSDDEGPGTDAQAQAILATLGQKKRNEVMAMVYMMRADNSTIVRQESLHVWKSVVSNTPRMLRECLPHLMNQIIMLLSGTNSELQQLAGRTLGDVVKKLGDRVLPDIIPILEKGLESPAANTRTGVCLGLKEVMASAPKWLMSEYVDALIPAVGKALCDNLPEVREAAAQTFDTLHRLVGNKAMDEILPQLLHLLEDSHMSDRALDGIRQILEMKSASVLSYLIPKMIQPPMKVTNARALSAIAQAAPGNLNRYFAAIIPALAAGISSNDSTVSDASAKSLKDVVLAVTDDGLQYLFEPVFGMLKSDDPEHRRGGCIAIDGFCEGTSTDYAFYLRAILQWLVKLLNDSSNGVILAAYGAMDSLCKKVKKDELVKYMKFIQEVLHNVTETPRKLDKEFLLPGFCIPKGPGPLLQVFLHGLMNGSPEQREQASECIYDIIDYTSVDILKPFVIQITGPLIRIIGDRFPWQVKSAILQTLRILLIKGSATLKPFIPQLQTTFVKSLSDPTRVVRNRAAVALSKLISLGTRVDPLVTELVNSAKSSQAGIREAILKALEGAIAQAGQSITPANRTLVRTTMVEYIGGEDDISRQLAARVFGALVRTSDAQEFETLVKFLTTEEGEDTWVVYYGKALALGFTFATKDNRLQTKFDAIAQKLEKLLSDDKPFVRQSSADAVARLVAVPSTETPSHLSRLIPALSKVVSDEASDARRSAVMATKEIAKAYPKAIEPHLPTIVPNLLACARGTNLPVKLAAERALLYALQTHAGDETLTRFLAAVDEKTQKLVADYARRVLKQLTTGHDSDADEEEGEGADKDE